MNETTDNSKQPLTAEEILSKSCESQTKLLKEEIERLKGQLVAVFSESVAIKEGAELGLEYKKIYIEELEKGVIDLKTKNAKISESLKYEQVTSGEIISEYRIKTSELESSLSLAKKENEDFRDYIIKKDFDNRKLIEELTSVKEQLESTQMNYAKILAQQKETIQIKEEQNKELAEAFDNLIKMVVKYHPNVSIPEQEDLYFSLHKGKEALTNNQQTKP